MTHSKNDKEPHSFFKLNQGNKGKNQQHRYMNEAKIHRDIKQNSIQNEKIHSSQWTYLECLIELDLLVFKLCFSISLKYPPRTPSIPTLYLSPEKWLGLPPQEILTHPITTLFSHLSTFLLSPKPHLLKNSLTRLSPINFSDPFFASYLLCFSFVFLSLS